jgi:hypothetical protein
MKYVNNQKIRTMADNASSYKESIFCNNSIFTERFSELLIGELTEKLDNLTKHHEDNSMSMFCDDDFDRGYSMELDHVYEILNSQFEEETEDDNN